MPCRSAATGEAAAGFPLARSPLVTLSPAWPTPARAGTRSARPWVGNGGDEGLPRDVYRRCNRLTRPDVLRGVASDRLSRPVPAPVREKDAWSGSHRGATGEAAAGLPPARSPPHPRRGLTGVSGCAARFFPVAATSPDGPAPARGGAAVAGPGRPYRCHHQGHGEWPVEWWDLRARRPHPPYQATASRASTAF